MMRTVPNRRCESIGPFIKEYVLRESVLHTDKYATYLSFFNQTDEYEHGTVNHKLHFGKSSIEFWRENQNFENSQVQCPMPWNNIEELFKRLKLHEICTVEEVLKYIDKPVLILRIVACPTCNKPMRKKKETGVFIGLI
ncbi:hypothetical protein PAPHI01_2790 [Pancytospora philotis]|nr:hypothetical protein PAPHI01_2790 [Pancytospora philotis]